MTTVDPYALTDGPLADDTGTARPGTPSPDPRAPITGAAGPATAQPARRRGGGDPVKALLHRHRELCERAVDALEVAAGLEAHGITDRTAARFRHRDVFSLAEELYARTPRGETPAPPPARTPAGPRAVRRFGCALLPGALAFAAAAAGTPWTGPLTVLLTAGALVWPGRRAGGPSPTPPTCSRRPSSDGPSTGTGRRSEPPSRWPWPPDTSPPRTTPPGPAAGSPGAGPWRTSPPGPGPCSPGSCCPSARPPRGRPRSPGPTRPRP